MRGREEYKGDEGAAVAAKVYSQNCRPPLTDNEQIVRVAEKTDTGDSDGLCVCVEGEGVGERGAASVEGGAVKSSRRRQWGHGEPPAAPPSPAPR